MSAVLVAFGVPTAARAEEGRDQSTPVIDVEVTTEGSDSVALEDAIGVHVAAQLDALGQDAEQAQPLYIEIVVGWEDDAASIYAIGVTVERGGDVLGRSDRSCAQCGTDEVFGQISTSIDDLVREQSSPSTEAAPQPTDTPRPAPAQAPRRAHRLGALGWTGVALTCAGLLVGAGGIALWSKGRVIDPDTVNAAIFEGTNYKPPGIALTLVGGAALASGIVMLVLDAKEGRRRRAAVATLFGPQATTVGATVMGRF